MYRFMIHKLTRLIFLFSLLTSLGSCSNNLPGGGNGNLNPATPTPPLPVFGDFMLSVATSGTQAIGSQGPVNPSTEKYSIVSFLNDSIRLTETRHMIKEISFEADHRTENEIEFPQSYIVSLIKQGKVVNEVSPTFEPTQLPFDTYHEFKMKFDRLESDKIPVDLIQDPLVTDSLVGHSWVVEGNFLESKLNDINHNGKIDYIPFRILLEDEASVKVKSPHLFSILPDQINYFFIAFKAENWFEGALPELQAFSLEDLIHGTLVISKNNSQEHAKNLLEIFKKNLEKSCKSAPSNDNIFMESDVDEDSSSDVE